MMLNHRSEGTVISTVGNKSPDRRGLLVATFSAGRAVYKREHVSIVLD